MESTSKKTSPLDFFLNLGMIAMLYFSVFNLLGLLFSVIDYAFPDVSLGYSNPSDSLWSIAALIIVVPVYLLLNWYVHADYQKYPEKRELGVRKWLIYLTLFIAGLGIVIDLVYLIYTFLQGEITVRFMLKVLAVFAVAGGVFGYYIADIRKNAGTKIFMIGTAVFVLAAIIGGFMVTGTPSQQRAVRLDTQRINDLQSIQSQMVYYWQQKSALPASLSDLNNALSNFTVPKDPETAAPYEYVKQGDLKFQLCATFKAASQPNDTSRMYAVPYPGGIAGADDYFKHTSGHQCFERSIDPAFFKNQNPGFEPKGAPPIPVPVNAQ